MDFLNKFDTFLLDNVFQKISDRFQILTEKNCFFLARICFIISSGAAIVKCGIEYKNHNYSTCLMDIVFSMSLLGLSCGTIFDEHSFDYKFRNAEYLKGQERRILYFWITLLFPVKSFLLPASVFLVFAMYFNACTPLPPCRGKIRELFDKLFSFTLKPAEVKAESQ